MIIKARIHKIITKLGFDIQILHDIQQIGMEMNLTLHITIPSAGSHTGASGKTM